MNALGEKESVSEAQTIEDLKVMLQSQDGLAVTPDSLYYGSEQELTKAGGVAKETEIVIRLISGSIRFDSIRLLNESNTNLSSLIRLFVYDSFYYFYLPVLVNF